MSSDKDMALFDHIGELRKRLIWVLVFLIIGMAVGLYIAKPVLLYLQQLPPANGMKWHVFSPWDSLRLYMSFALVIGFIVTMPVLMYHLWAFVSPGLRDVERGAALMYMPFAVVLYLLGLAFGYFVVFKMAFHFSTSIAGNLQVEETYGAAQYFSFMFNIIIPLSILFELPIVVMFLTKIRLLNPARLAKFRKLAYMVLVILAAVITPPDAISAILVFVPMVVLYEFSVLLSGIIHRKQLVVDAAWEQEYGAK
ncbi:twin-arginine translocase subunit TatC [Paenibacillus sp. N1-5-1-14]|uniref:twin-arginine translocase subunit TatC n=1 Tax=Paenibacillus radicibacter TaxID=2972488 RepID=UPI0021597CE7|nr:twin-arginine translocase subunit TatC [Paenibacillus radicibacter]MCR8643595.1 twin-arginine translocase subunit TatC [Paenibacillus radicibacter]